MYEEKSNTVKTKRKNGFDVIFERTTYTVYVSGWTKEEAKNNNKIRNKTVYHAQAYTNTAEQSNCTVLLFRFDSIFGYLSLSVSQITFFFTYLYWIFLKI